MASKKPERFRNNQINIRVSDYEKMLIDQKVKKSGASSMQEYMIITAINGYIINVDYSEIKNLAYEINKIGVNINQIAHKINSENRIYKPQMDELQDCLDLIWKAIRNKFYQLP